MAAKSKVSQPGFVKSSAPHQACFSSVTDSNWRKADDVMTSWQQVFTCSARKEKLHLIYVGFESKGKKSYINMCLGKEIPDTSVLFLLEV